jgi:hypothetical protein
MSGVIPFSIIFGWARNVREDLADAARKVFANNAVSQTNAAGTVITPALSAALPESMFVKRSVVTVVLYVVFTICSAGIFAVVKNVIHMLWLRKFTELMTTYKADASSNSASADRRAALLSSLGLTNFSSHIEALAKALGGTIKPVPQPSPASTSTNPELEVFTRACVAVGIKDCDPLDLRKK